MQITSCPHSGKSEFLVRFRWDALRINNRGYEAFYIRQRARLWAEGKRSVNKCGFLNAYQEFFLNIYPNESSGYAENWALSGYGLPMYDHACIEAGVLSIRWKWNNVHWFDQWYL